MIDVSEKHLQIVVKILSGFVPDCEIRVFGSRYTGKTKPYSDLDLAIVGRQQLPKGMVYNIIEAFQESDLPWRVDVLDWHSISPEFRAVIEKSGYEVLTLINK